ncbi:MAG TPA: hypothetical protein PKZ08_14400 [Vicinamibacterales bacterium]|nr:hypothetical protein [Vicinamibacterales bacterium]
MSAPTLTSALAVPFAWTSAGNDVVLAFASGTSPVNVTIPSATYRMVLAPAASDFVRVYVAAINAAIIAAGRTEVFAATVGADSRITLTSTGAFTMSPLLSAAKLLGFSSAIVTQTSVTAAYPPANLATFVERVSADWSPRSAVAGAETLAGVGYGVYSGTWREEDEIAFGFIPRDPTTRAALAVDQTPWMPDAGDLVGAAMPRQWTCRDVLETAGGKTCAAALGNFQSLRTSTTATYDLVTLPFPELAAPRKARVREGWDAYFRWTVRMLRQSTQTGTRA